MRLVYYGLDVFNNFAGFGATPHGNMPGFSMDGFNMDGFTSSSGHAMKQDPPVEQSLFVTFEELLTGRTKKMKITRDILVPGGNRTTSEQKVLEINVKKGWKEGTKVTFPKEGNQKPNKTPADIVFVIKDKPHDLFTRDKENNLIYKATISLRDALCGTNISVKTLTGQIIPLELKTVSPTTKRIIKGEGLPLPKTPERRADLVVEFDIIFPKNLTSQQVESLKQILPP